MAIEKGKPDLLTVLSRRKVTVSSFLDHAGVRNLPSLNTFLKTLKSTYSLSNQFLREANVHVLTKYVPPVVEPATEETTDEVTEEEVDEGEEGQEEEKPKKKPGRRSSTKKKVESGFE